MELIGSETKGYTPMSEEKLQERQSGEEHAGVTEVCPFYTI